jgi:hypothetical protein
MVHGNPVANPNVAESDGRTAPHVDTRLYGIDYSVQFHMPWYNIIGRIGYSNQRSAQFFIRIPHSLEQGAMGGTLYARFYAVTFHPSPPGW